MVEPVSIQRSPSIWADLRGTSFSQGWLNAGGVKTRYLASGETGQPVLLLLHGIGGHAEAYTRNLKAHGEHFRTLAIDLLGHGYTDKPGHPLEIPHYIQHLLAVMEELNVEKVFLGGESLGGWVAARFAIDYPERVERVALNTMGGSQSDPVVMARIKALSTEAARDPSWERVGDRVRWLMADDRDATDDLIATRRAIYSQPGFASAMDDIMALQDPKIRQRNLLLAEDFGRLHAPALVLWTSDDPTGDVSEGRRISTMIPNSQFVVMDKCGHWPQWEHADEFNRIHLDFLLGR